MSEQNLRIATVKLAGEDARYIDEQIASGLYPDAAAVLTDALHRKRKAEQDEAAFDAELLQLVNVADVEDARGDFVDVTTPQAFDAIFGHLQKGSASK